MLAKNVNNNAGFLSKRGACGFFASKLAPTGNVIACWVCAFSSGHRALTVQRLIYQQLRNLDHLHHRQHLLAGVTVKLFGTDSRGLQHFATTRSKEATVHGVVDRS